MKSRDTFLASLIHESDRRHSLANLRTSRILATDLEGAFDSKRRRKGLLGRPGLAKGSALIIAPCNSIHTFFMHFAIDIAFVDRHGKILKVRHAVPAWRLSVSWRAFAVVEMPAGTLEASGTRAGDDLAAIPSPAVDAGAPGFTGASPLPRQV